MSEKPPNPGSPLAVAQGCLCPVFDNACGAGLPGFGDNPVFWENEDCPLHGRKG